MVCDQPFCISYLDHIIQKLTAMSIISNRINGTSDSDSDIPWKFLPVKLKVCDSFKLYDSPLTKSVKIF